MSYEWEDLSDDELLQRLLQRDMPRSEATHWVEYRESGSCARAINAFLEDKW